MTEPPSPSESHAPPDTRAAEVAAAVASVRARVAAAAGRAGRDPAAVTVVAVTKTWPVSDAAAVLAAGVVDLGENRAADLVAKATDPVLAEQVIAPRWHMIGQCQTNKVGALAPFVCLWQSVDRAALAARIAARAPGAAVLLQVDTATSTAGRGTSGDVGRGGVAPDGVAPLLDEARSLGLDVRGLMAVAPLGTDPRPCFDTVVALAGRLGLRESSIGMSDDYELAVEHGATIVRVGRSLFGARS